MDLQDRQQNGPAFRGNENLGRINRLITDLATPEMPGRERVEPLVPLLPESKAPFPPGDTVKAIVHYRATDDKRKFAWKALWPLAAADEIRMVLAS